MSVLVLSKSGNEGEQLLDELQDDTVVEAVAETRRSDDRANVPVSVVTERFLRAILDQVPLDRVEELHLFSPLRQGTIETGIAVVAARVMVMEAVTMPQPLVPSSETTDGGDAAAPDAAASNDAVPDVAAPDAAAPDDGAQDAAADAPLVLEPPSFAAESQEPRVRHTVYTARYRLIVKGPERGKWEMDVVDEADAPLLAVETVVRGVQRRAGEDTATVRYDASQLARVLRMPVPE